MELMATLLEIIDLVKTYDRQPAVDGVSFAIEAGRCFGLLGPNGAGKTTTIEVIEDVIKPDSGQIRFDGQPRDADFHDQVGIQFQSTTLLGFLTVRETLQTFRDLFIRGADIDHLVTLCHLEDFQHQYNDRISGGQRQRFLLALALINDPRLLFLDEPSTGLDPQARRNLWELINNIKTEGKTIVLTTHYMEEAQRLCDEVAIMDCGKIIARGTPQELIRRHTAGITVSLPRKALTEATAAIGQPYRQGGDRVEFRTRDANSCLSDLLAAGVDLADVAVRTPNLETVFLNLTGRKLRE
jgi:ABC-2 type transport system ATP-binding protein